MVKLQPRGSKTYSRCETMQIGVIFSLLKTVSRVNLWKTIPNLRVANENCVFKWALMNSTDCVEMDSCVRNFPGTIFLADTVVSYKKVIVETAF